MSEAFCPNVLNGVHREMHRDGESTVRYLDKWKIVETCGHFFQIESKAKNKYYLKGTILKTK